MHYLKRDQTLLPAYFFFPIHDVQEPNLYSTLSADRIEPREEKSYDSFSLNSQEFFLLIEKNIFPICLSVNKNLRNAIVSNSLHYVDHLSASVRGGMYTHLDRSRQTFFYVFLKFFSKRTKTTQKPSLIVQIFHLGVIFTPNRKIDEVVMNAYKNNKHHHKHNRPKNITIVRNIRI